MKIPILIISFFLICVVGNAQIISQFTWDSNPVTSADVGPDATSVSGSATSDINGVGGTNGLNAALPKLNLDFIIPTGSGVFDVPGIDVSFDYQRDESAGTFFRRGNSLIINGCANLSVTYRVDDGAGGFNTVSSGNQYAIPNDAVFRTYRFYYLPATGYGALMVNGVEVWSNDGVDHRNMYWAGSGNITIGSGMDGSGSNRTFLDNLIIGSVTFSALPIELVDFSATKTNDDFIKLNWETASELNNDYFTIQKSLDGNVWEDVVIVDGAGNSTSAVTYESIDKKPYSGVSYYRLKQTDFDGNYTYSKTRKVILKSLSSNLLVYPNPSSDVINIEGSELGGIMIYNTLGENVSNRIKTTKVSDSKFTLYIADLPVGVYYLKTETGLCKIYKK